MKKIKGTVLIFALLTSAWAFGQTEESVETTLADQFSLEGALDLFKKSEDLAAFEASLNKEDNLVSNLDLNDDGNIDYIKVIDYQDGDDHAITLQIDLDENETQDIAVLGLVKEGKENAIIQIIGDESIFGNDVIVEPLGEGIEQGGAQDGKGGPNPASYKVNRIVVNVWFWPSVRYIYGPRYRRPYVSPYRWRVYPRSWAPWSVRPWGVYRTKRVGLFRGYHRAPVFRVARVHKVYAPKRRASKRVTVRKTTVVKRNSNNGNVVRRSTTTTTKKTAGGKKVTKSRSKTVKKRNGKVVKKKNKVTKRKKGN